MVASIVGAIVTNSFVHAAFVIPARGFNHHVQEYNRNTARLEAGLLFLAKSMVPLWGAAGPTLQRQTYLPFTITRTQAVLAAAAPTSAS